MPEVKNIIPQSTPTPLAPPDPVKIKKDGQERTKRKRNPLRINLESGGGGGGTSGVNV